CHEPSGTQKAVATKNTKRHKKGEDKEQSRGNRHGQWYLLPLSSFRAFLCFLWLLLCFPSGSARRTYSPYIASIRSLLWTSTTLRRSLRLTVISSFSTLNGRARTVNFLICSMRDRSDRAAWQRCVSRSTTAGCSASVSGSPVTLGRAALRLVQFGTSR